MSYNLAAIRELVAAAFSDEELRTLCFGHYSAVYEQFAAGQSKDDRVLRLVEHADRHGLLNELLAVVKAANLHQYTLFEPRLGVPDGPSSSSSTSLPPQRISLAKLPSTHPDLFGRERELGWLDEAWAGSGTNIVEFVAWGGVGKTALVNKWLAAMAQEGYRGAERVFGWSFYSQGAAEGKQASADPFIAAALAWFGDPDPNAGSPWDKGERLAELVASRRTLLMLDGLEPLQHPPGEMGGRLRDPSMQSLLRELARRPKAGLCVLTTRLAVDDIQDCVAATVRLIELEQLSPDAGEAYLRRLGVQGDSAELREAVEEYDGHALALTLLGTLLRDTCDGDVRRCKEVGPLEGEMGQGWQARRVMQSYEKWLGEGPELAALRLMGLFDRPAEGAALAVLRAAPSIAGLTDALFRQEQVPGLGGLLGSKKPVPLADREWDRAILKLRRARLLDERDPADPAALDTHPLVREHFGEQLKQANSAAWRDAHGRLYEYYKRRAPDRPDTIEAMAPLYAAVAHGCAAGRHQEALDEVYWRRIQRGNEFYTTWKLGALGADLAALAGFFDPPWRRPVAGLTEADKAFLLNEAGYALRALGRLAEAREPMAAALEDCIARKHWQNAARAADNLSELSLSAGDLPAAIRCAEQSVELADRSGDAFERMSDRTTLADALHQAGRSAEAAALFREAEELQAARQPEYPLLYSLQGYQYCDLLLAQAQAEEVLRRAGQTLEWVTAQNWLLDIALDHLSLGRAHLMLADLTPSAPPSLAGKGEGRIGGIGRAAAELDRAVEGLRQAGHQEFVALGLLACAALRRVTGDFDRARRDLDEVLAIATRGGMRLHEADYHLEYARLFLAMDDAAQAREHFATAQRMVSELGYARRDREVAELAAALSF